MTGALATAPPASAVGYRGRMLRMLNEIRSNHGLAKLTLNLKLSRYAKRHSRDMMNGGTLWHTNNLYGRVDNYGATCWGENIGYAGTVRRIVQMWMNSASHRENILTRCFHRTGIGIVKGARYYWATLIMYG